MSTQPENSSVSRRQFLVAAGGAVAANSVPGAKMPNDESSAVAAPTQYIVTIDVTHATSNLTLYTCTCNGNCNGNCGAGQSAYRLYLHPNDTVKWRAKTKSPKHSVGIFFPDVTPLYDPNTGRSLFFIVFSEREEGAANEIVAAVEPTANQGSYDYYIAVFDGTTTIAEDPKIIIGSGGLTKGEVTDELKDVEHKLEAVGSEKSLDQVKKLLEPIETKLQRIIDGLQ